jgi:hypothetical protein
MTEVDKLVQMLRRSYFALMDGGETDIETDELVGDLGEFLALWDEDESAFVCGDDKTPLFVSMVNKLRKMENDCA